MRSIMRDTDIVGRMGGDEFLIFLKNMGSVRSIRRKAQEICDIFRNTRIGNSGRPVSGSVGVALYPHDGKSFDGIVCQGRCRIIWRKRRGKDGYMLYSSENRTGGGRTYGQFPFSGRKRLSAPGFQAGPP
jgi:GGDEF domain-containing protein